MKNNIKLYVDFDSTMVDSIKRFVELANKKFNVEQKIDNLYDYGFKNMYSDISQEDIQNIFGSEEFFDENLEFIKGCKEVLYKYKDSYDIIILTASKGNNLIHKKEWISKNLPFVKKVISTNNNNKSIKELKNSIQIDDIVECLNTNAKVKLLFKNNNNYIWQRHMNDDIYDVNYWDEIDKILDFYLKVGIQ